MNYFTNGAPYNQPHVNTNVVRDWPNAWLYIMVWRRGCSFTLVKPVLSQLREKERERERECSSTQLGQTALHLVQRWRWSLSQAVSYSAPWQSVARRRYYTVRQGFLRGNTHTNTHTHAHTHTHTHTHKHTRSCTYLRQLIWIWNTQLGRLVHYDSIYLHTTMVVGSFWKKSSLSHYRLLFTYIRNEKVVAGSERAMISSRMTQQPCKDEFIFIPTIQCSLCVIAEKQRSFRVCLPRLEFSLWRSSSVRG